MTPTALLQQMQESTLGVALSESIYMYPLVEGSHLISLVFSFGLLLLTDLRLIGFFLPSVPVSDFLGRLRPLILVGFSVTFITGFLLVFVNGPSLMKNIIFPLKVVLIFLAGLNALWFELKFGRQVNEWGPTAALPQGAVAAGWISLIIWSLVVICGRLIPYLAVH